MSVWDAIRDLLFRITPYLPGIVGFLVFLAIALTVFLIIVTRRMRKKDPEESEEEGVRSVDDDPDYEPFSAEPDDLPLLPMRKSFQHALKILRRHVSGRDWRYAIPWYLLVGPEQSGKSSLIAHTGMDLPVGHPAEDYEDLRPACKWWFFDRGVVLDTAGALFRQKDGRGSNSKAWTRFLGFLDRYRPRRPADGIILTIPIEDFLDDQGALRPQEDIAQRADAIYKKLWQAQTRLGLSFPVYVIVTKLDRLPGFQTLVGELPDHTLADMLGWASPYSFETEFREQWIDEAIDTVGTGLQATQMEIFATVGEAAVAEDIYRLPAAFNGLREPLRNYLRQIFKPSVYHDSFTLRGIWFTGDSGFEFSDMERPVPVLSGVYGGPRSRQAYPVFLRDLFETKIFPERNMARPVKRALTARNKMATGAQAASLGVAVFGGVALWFLHGEMHRDVSTVTPFIETVARDIREVRADRRAGEHDASSAGFSRERALVLLEGMAALETGSFSSFIIPSSWVASVDDRVVRVTTDAFSLFILQAMGAALDERGVAIGAGRIPPRVEGGFGQDSAIERIAASLPDGGRGATPPGLAAPPERGPEYARLRDYVLAIRDFESAVERYNSLRETHSLEDIRKLVSYLFSVQLPESFLENSDFYRDALIGSNYREIPLTAYQREIGGRFENYMNAALDELYAGNPLMRSLSELALMLDDLSTRRSAGIEALRNLRGRIADIRQKIEDPKYAWMDDPSFDPAIAYASAADRIGGSRLLGPQQAANFNAAHIKGLTELRAAMPDLRTISVGPMLDRDGNRTVLRLAPAVTEFYAVVEALFQQPFMREGRYQPLPGPPPTGSMVEWNANILGEGLDLVESYEAFVRDEIDRVPRGLQPLVRTAGGELLERAVNDRVAAAIVTPRGRSTSSVQSEDALRRAVAAFAEAGVVMSEILGAYDQLGLEDSYLDLLDLSVATAIGLIEEADSLFSAGALYVPRGGDFDFWDGTPGLALEAFRARDPFELRDILSQQRGRIGIIANGYVKPVSDFLANLDIRLSEREAGLLGKWRRIIEELQKYELQQADNTVAELERFITGPMLDVKFATCAATLDDAVAERRSADFFLDRVTRLSRGIRGRCLDLAGIEAQTAYSAIADAFDDHLAGRYPFTLTPFESDMREAAPRDLRAFFARYDREVEAARLALEQADDLGFSRDRALEFVARMDRIRAFFGPWLTSTGGEDTSVFDMAVSFRVNRDRETGGDQVIDWQLSSGPDVVTLRGEKTPLRWSLGEPIALRLRWADNSTRVPAVAVDQPQIRVDGRRVEIVYDNLWSLMDLIRRHRSGSDDFSEFVDPRPHTLRVEIPTRPEGGGPIELARLFLRVELSTLQEGQPVPLVMTPFPYEAPRLEP